MRNIQGFSNFTENFKNPFRKETREEKWKRFLEEYELVITDLDGKPIDISTDKTEEFRIYYEPKKDSAPYDKKLLIGAVRIVMDNYYRIDNLMLHYYVYESVTDKRMLRRDFSYVEPRWFDEPHFGTEKELMNAREKPMGRLSFNANPSKTYQEQRIQLLMNILNTWQGTTFPGYKIYSSNFRAQNN
jgi:hypothetical protein